MARSNKAYTKASTDKLIRNMAEDNAFMHDEKTLSAKFKHGIRAHRGEIKQEINRRIDD